MQSTRRGFGVKVSADLDAGTCASQACLDSDRPAWVEDIEPSADLWGQIREELLRTDMLRPVYQQYDALLTFGIPPDVIDTTTTPMSVLDDFQNDAYLVNVIRLNQTRTEFLNRPWSSLGDIPLEPGDAVYWQFREGVTPPVFRSLIAEDLAVSCTGPLLEIVFNVTKFVTDCVLQDTESIAARRKILVAFEKRFRNQFIATPIPQRFKSSTDDFFKRLAQWACSMDELPIDTADFQRSAVKRRRRWDLFWWHFWVAFSSVRPDLLPADADTTLVELMNEYQKYVLQKSCTTMENMYTRAVEFLDQHPPDATFSKYGVLAPKAPALTRNIPVDVAPFLLCVPTYNAAAALGSNVTNARFLQRGFSRMLRTHAMAAFIKALCEEVVTCGDSARVIGDDADDTKIQLTITDTCPLARYLRYRAKKYADDHPEGEGVAEVEGEAVAEVEGEGVAEGEADADGDAE